MCWRAFNLVGSFKKMSNNIKYVSWSLFYRPPFWSLFPLGFSALKPRKKNETSLLVLVRLLTHPVSQAVSVDCVSSLDYSLRCKLYHDSLWRGLLNLPDHSSFTGHIFLDKWLCTPLPSPGHFMCRSIAQCERASVFLWCCYQNSLVSWIQS